MSDFDYISVNFVFEAIIISRYIILGKESVTEHWVSIRTSSTPTTVESCNVFWIDERFSPRSSTTLAIKIRTAVLPMFNQLFFSKVNLKKRGNSLLVNYVS